MLGSLGKLNKVNLPLFILEKTLYWSHIERRTDIVISEAEHSSVTVCQRQSGVGGDSAVHEKGESECEVCSQSKPMAEKISFLLA